MICTNCNTVNGGDDVFCVNCGNAISGVSPSALPTVPYPRIGQPTPGDSDQTAVVDVGQHRLYAPQFTPSSPYSGVHQTKKSNPLIWIAGGLVVVLGLVAGGVFILGSRLGGSTEVLPDHLGMFVQSSDKTRNDEIPKQDFAKVIEAKNAFMKNDSLLALEPQPSLILYADGKDVPINDLRLIQLDTIKDDGNMQLLDFQVAPVDGKPEMKRMRVPAPIANGKYAFALLDTYSNEGKHRFWAFQVKNSTRSDNGSALVASSVPVKPTPSPPPSAPRPQPAPAPVIPPPPGSTAMRVSGNSVRLRSGPSTSSAIVSGMSNGQVVHVFGYTGYDCFNNRCGPWAQVQTTTGRSGYILSVLLR